MDKLAMSWSEWGKLDGIALAELVRNGKVTPKELAEQAATAVKIMNPKLNAVLEVFDDVVESPYKDGMSKEGSFHGVPMLVKDLGSVMKGRVQEQGTLLFKGFRSDHDSPVIESLRAAGLNLIGRTATPPLGFAAVTESFISGITRNPWNLDYSPGGSSGGSAAAVAAGIVPIATACDFGGSIRDPAMFCGLIGLKATRGRVPLPRGWANEFSSFEFCECVVTRTVRDTALVLDYISRHKLGDTFMPIPKPEHPYIEDVTRDPGKLHIAFSTGRWGREKDAHPEVIACTRRVAEVLRSLGHIVEEVKDEDICDWEAMWRSLQLNYGSAPKRWKDISTTTGVAINQQTLEPPLYWLYRAAQKYSDFDVWHLQEDNAIITRWFGQLFAKYDLLLCPASAEAFIKAGLGSGYSLLDKLENEEQANTWLSNVVDESRYYIPGNDTGIPGIAMPAGFGGRGLPLGVQLYAPWLREDRLLQMTAQLERAKPEWFNQIPPLHVSKV